MKAILNNCEQSGKRPVSCPVPAERLSGLGLSPIRAIQNGAAAGTISLGLGEPGWDMPACARAALEAFGRDQGPCPYGPNAGTDELRAAVAARENADPSEIMISAGSEEAVFALMLAYAGPGDEVLVPDPGYLAYPAIAKLAGAISRPYALGPHFELDADQFEAAIRASSSIKVAIINSPSNPTGGAADVETLKRIAALCAGHGILLISDEVYRELYLGDPPPGIRSIALNAGTACAVTSSVSKAWGAPGLRIGWAVGARSVLAPAMLIHNYALTSASRPAQAAALALIRESGTVLNSARQELRIRWDTLEQGLEPIIGRLPRAPSGGFYYWLRLPSNDSTAFCMQARDRGGVILVPGAAFGKHGEGYARLSFGGKPEQIREGLARLMAIWPCASRKE